MKIGSIMMLFGGLMLLSACSVTEWENPNSSPDQLAFDRQHCQSVARAETEKVLRRQPIPSESQGNILGRDYDAAMARYDIGRQTERSFFRCMEFQGYRRISKPLF